ncbi:PAS domain-containing sensor histidine kinase [Cytophagales bacterium WSM2-2]|nr:PAS domain-containing sensor histidine kinase [Cytophagales bacterium WSM2-2]
MNILETQYLLQKHFISGVLKSIREGLLVLNEANQIEVTNEAALKLFGFSKNEELSGRHFEALCADKTAVKKFIALLETQGSVKNHEGVFIRFNEQQFIGSCSATIISDRESSGVVKLIFIRDVSEEKKSLEKLAEYANLLEKNNKELDQFAYIVSHDLKAPLRAISNLSVWLQEDLGPLSDENKNNLELLQGRVKRLESLINGILEYSKVGREKASSETIDVFQLITEVLEMLSPPSNIKVDISLEMSTIDAPKTMLYQVFSNLVSNAIKYNDKKEGQIKVIGADCGTHYEFAIEDNGPGIEKEYHEKIFVIFQTLQSRDKFESTGIGLTIVKRIVEDRKGKVWVESEPGKGSKFIFTWPKQDSAESK